MSVPSELIETKLVLKNTGKKCQTDAENLKSYAGKKQNNTDDPVLLANSKPPSCKQLAFAVRSVACLSSVHMEFDEIPSRPQDG